MYKETQNGYESLSLSSSRAVIHTHHMVSIRLVNLLNILILGTIHNNSFRIDRFHLKISHLLISNIYDLVFLSNYIWDNFNWFNCATGCKVLVNTSIPGIYSIMPSERIKIYHSACIFRLGNDIITLCAWFIIMCSPSTLKINYPNSSLHIII